VPVGVFWMLIGGGIVAGCGISRSLSMGAFTNVLMPVHALLAIFFGLGVVEAVRGAEQAATAQPTWRTLPLFVWTCCLLQFGLLAYLPRNHLPTAADRAAGEQFVEWMGGVDGDVWVVGHGFLSSYADKPTFLHTVEIFDLSVHPATRDMVRTEVEGALRNRRFAAVVLDDDLEIWRIMHPWFVEALETNYTLDRRFFGDGKAFFPVTGSRNRPDLVYLRR